TNNIEAVLFAYTENSKIENVTASNNECGIYLDFSNNNIIIEDTASNNDCCGIYIDSSSNNTLVGNSASKNVKTPDFR
ncbi:MAG: NosD domain-containing protein, partial [Euryarchaeota archaeon]|nr:NosD domain-containing protein [Euryarchaeota archaeon]